MSEQTTEQAMSTTTDQRQLRRVAVASLVGTMVEWYDFYIYGTAAALALGDLFFPKLNSTAQTLSAFATFAIGFLARPLGGVLFGHLGDRAGRKLVLMATLLMMGFSTFAIGLLPTYESIGVAAPILLVVLRFLQGIAVGGEWGGAVLLGVERAPARRRAFYGSFAQVGSPLGLLVAAGVFALVETLPSAAVHSWGWRIPFLLSVVLIGIGQFVRSRIEETPVAHKEKTKLPLGVVLRDHWVAVLLGTGAMVVTLTGFYLSTTFLTSYGTKHLGFASGDLLVGTMLVAVVQIVALPLAAMLADRAGRQPVLLAGTLLSAALSIPLFALAGTGTVALLWLGMILYNIGRSLVYGPLPAFAAAMFPAEVRFTGISLCYQLAGIVGGGFAPLIAVALAGKDGHAMPVAGYLAATGVLSAVCVFVIGRRTDHLKGNAR
ncbi:MHS family MFS transporter [Amycolatopsis acidicola]|uniref:Putative proline/betaine transporter n=1 Tax=Amycolatopsis acidicola TaxID=2596893 RepID=A0A5N0VFI1_9PSEU|nr:MFS transporter [Amycolatopsis acidicola]KAA9163571.1 MHS family MFS transporter [Amycolatopsis acidicola]